MGKRIKIVEQRVDDTATLFEGDVNQACEEIESMGEVLNVNIQHYRDGGADLMRAIIICAYD